MPSVDGTDLLPRSLVQKALAALSSANRRVSFSVLNSFVITTLPFTALGELATINLTELSIDSE